MGRCIIANRIADGIIWDREKDIGRKRRRSIERSSVAYAADIMVHVSVTGWILVLDLSTPLLTLIDVDERRTREV